MKAPLGFVHAGTASQAATTAAIARRRAFPDVVHLVDTSLVDAGATAFVIDDARYSAMRARVVELAPRVERVVLSCSVYNGVAASLAEDCGLPVERSDAAGAQRLRGTEGPVGILVSYAPSHPIIADYVGEVLAQDEDGREIHTSLAPDAFSFAGDAGRYREALLAALGPLRECGVLFVAQYSMDPHLEALRARWGERPLVNALDATLDRVAP